MSRRSLLGAAGVGAAGLAAGAFGGLGAARAATVGKSVNSKPAAAEHSQTDEHVNSDEHLVVHLRAGADGDIDLYHGTSQTTMRDPALAARLRRAAQ
ncbi:MAG: hypothetical protein ACRDNF_26465 [Streptosporangiaceae bacterium]